MKSLTTLLIVGILLCSPAFAPTAKAQATVATLTFVATFSDEVAEKEDESVAEKAPQGDSKVKLNGKVILIGPDGEKKEFDINDPKTATFLLEIGGDKDAEGMSDSEDAETEKGPAASEDVKLEERFVIGVQCEDASEVLRAHLGIADKGVVINDVREETPADEAGLQKYDVVLKINDKELLSREDLINSVLESEGKKLELAIIRAGKPLFMEVTPIKMKVPVAAASSTMDLNALSGVTAGQQIRLRLSHPGVLIQESVPQDQEEISRLVERIRSSAGDEAAKSMIEARDAMMLRAAQRHLRSEEQTKALHETLKNLQEQMKGLQEQMKGLQEQLPKGN